MENNIYTHIFDFTVENKFIRGEMKYDIDGKMSYKIKEISDPFSNDFLKAFYEFMELLEKLYKEQGDIKLIKIKRKEV